MPLLSPLLCRYFLLLLPLIDIFHDFSFTPLRFAADAMIADAYGLRQPFDDA